MNAAATIRRFDPANDTHYAISEDAEMRLRQIMDAADAVGTLFESADPERYDPQEHAIAAVFHTFAFAIEGALADRAVVFPGRNMGKKQ